MTVRNTKSAPPTKPLSQAQARPATKPAPPPARPTSTQKPAWTGASASLNRDLRATLASEAGRSLFAELLENQLNDPNATTGYVWDPADTKAMQWTLRAQEMGDDSLLVKVSGKDLSIVSESSGFEGKATFKGSTREALNETILRAVADLNKNTEAAREP